MELDITTPEFKQAVAAALRNMEFNLSRLDTTTPEFKQAVAGALPNEQNTGYYTNPDQTTGYWTAEGYENQGATLYDPTTGQYVDMYVDPENPRDFNPTHGLTRWTYTPEGDRVLTLMPVDDAGNMIRPHQNPDLEGLQWNYDPDPVYQPPSHGMGEDGRQRTTAPDDRYPVQEGSWNDPTPVDAGTPGNPLYNRPVYDYSPMTYESSPRNTSWEWADGGGHSYFGAPPVNANLNMPGELSPWGVPGTPGSNQDFYRAQFSNLLSQQNALREAELAAREVRANQTPQQAPSDPWGWAYGGQGLPEVQVGAGYTPGQQWQLAPGIIPGETSNADILRQMSTKPAFNDRGDAVRGLLNSNPDWETNYSWSRVPDPVTGVQNHIGSGWGPEVADVLNTMFGNMFIDTNQPQPGVPHVPQGYASPGNVAWGTGE